MVIWIKFAHSYPFQSLIPKMLMFNLAISCLARSNLPWFTGLTFQVPMQQCSSQHETLLSPPDTSTTEHHFCFGPDISFFLELLVIALCSSSVAYWTPSDTEGSPSGVVSVCLFILLTGFSWQKILEWVAVSFSSGPGQNSSLGPIHLGRPFTAWFLALLSDTSPFAMSRLWSMKGMWILFEAKWLKLKKSLWI